MYKYTLACVHWLEWCVIACTFVCVYMSELVYILMDICACV